MSFSLNECRDDESITIGAGCNGLLLSTVSIRAILPYSLEEDYPVPFLDHSKPSLTFTAHLIRSLSNDPKRENRFLTSPRTQK